jgi:CcmD family protein
LHRRFAISGFSRIPDGHDKPEKPFMNPWGFVFLAYGVVSTALLVYLFLLKRRLNKARTELARLRAMEEPRDHAKG